PFKTLTDVFKLHCDTYISALDSLTSQGTSAGTRIPQNNDASTSQNNDTSTPQNYDTSTPHTPQGQVTDP
ncbi:4173_t:CDS:1, partial [Gigaspora rosea]